jgi:hypothetical protein
MTTMIKTLAAPISRRHLFEGTVRVCCATTMLSLFGENVNRAQNSRVRSVTFW